MFSFYSWTYSMFPFYSWTYIQGSLIYSCTYSRFIIYSCTYSRFIIYSCTYSRTIIYSWTYSRFIIYSCTYSRTKIYFWTYSRTIIYSWTYHRSSIYSLTVYRSLFYSWTYSRSLLSLALEEFTVINVSWIPWCHRKWRLQSPKETSTTNWRFQRRAGIEKFYVKTRLARIWRKHGNRKSLNFSRRAVGDIIYFCLIKGCYILFSFLCTVYCGYVCLLSHMFMALN